MLIFSVLLLGRGVQPVVEMTFAERLNQSLKRVGPRRGLARRETLVIDCRAEIQGFGIGDYRLWVPCCTQELPNQLVLTVRFGTSQVDRAVQRLRKGHIHQGGGDIVRCDRLHHGRGKPDGLSFGGRLGNAAHEFEKTG
jgi:hypothetical protein